MPKIPVVKASKLLRVLKHLGFYEYHQAGSHIQMRHADGRKTTVPYHPSQEIGRKTLKGIISSLGMTIEEFTKECEGFRKELGALLSSELCWGLKN